MKAIKAVFLGEGRVGKTSIGQRWQNNSFDSQQKSTVAAGTFSKTLDTPAGLVDFNIWDTAGQEEFHALAPMYYKDAQIAILVYSVTDQTSFERMVRWHGELTNLLGDKVFIVVVANKIDMRKERVVQSSAGMEYAMSIGCQHFEVSAKTGEGIDLLFRYLNNIVSDIAKNMKSGRKKEGKMHIDVTDQSAKQESGGCC